MKSGRISTMLYNALSDENAIRAPYEAVLADADSLRHEDSPRKTSIRLLIGSQQW